MTFLDVQAETLFQSLSRDSGRLNYRRIGQRRNRSGVSIPQSGFGAFEHMAATLRCARGVQVSIPQSGFGAFEPFWLWLVNLRLEEFQSLSRDSGRLNKHA